jgi:deoxyribodipyrimidine photo-lyase
MKQVVWFRRDLRITDNELLTYAKGEVLPIFIFDTNILSKLSKDDTRVTFIYHAVLRLKKELQNIALDLAIFHGEPLAIFQQLKEQGFTEVLCGVDHDAYAKSRDHAIEAILPLRRFNTAFLIEPQEHLNQSQKPYKVFTPFYNSLHFLWESKSLETFQPNAKLKLTRFNITAPPTLEQIGFTEQALADFLEETPQRLLKKLITKLPNYEKERDAFAKNGTSQLSVHLRFGLLSPKEFFNTIRPYPKSEAVIRQLFFREFYNYLLYHFPHSEFENQKPITVQWENDEKTFQKWCRGETGVPIVDAAMQHFNSTGEMHNRLRMIVASFLTKNLLIDWRWGERYFASKLLDYDASANIASWQWAASTGSDAVPYFRIFNPYTQSEKFDKEGKFIFSVLKNLQGVEPKCLHQENGVQNSLFVNYPATVVPIKTSRLRAIERFKIANGTKENPHESI